MGTPFDDLSRHSWPTELPSHPDRRRVSQKEIDVFSREVLERHPSLREKIASMLLLLCDRDAPMPLIHVTSESFHSSGEGPSAQGFVDQIRERGFRARDTNVAAFLDRTGSPPMPGKPAYFSSHPDTFVKDFALMVQRYLHHGIRSNKEVLKESRDQVVGVPALLIIEGGVMLVRGTDYDDHFRFQEAWPGDKVIGVVHAADVTSYKQEETFVRLLGEVVGAVIQRYQLST